MTDNLFPNLAHENCKETMPPVTTEQFKEAAILEKNLKLEEILNIVDKKKPSIKNNEDLFAQVLYFTFNSELTHKISYIYFISLKNHVY